MNKAERSLDNISCMKTKIDLEQSDWGQIIDGLECRAEQYEKTVRYFELGESNGEIEEVSGVEEARSLAKLYRSLIAKIQRQR